MEFFTEFVNRKTNLGADYGVLLTTIQSRLVDWRGTARATVNERLAGTKELDLQVSNDAAARIVKAITVDEPFYDVCNLPYTGSNLPGVPSGAVIERMCTYDGRGAHPVEVKPLPPPLQAHLALHAPAQGALLFGWQSPPGLVNPVVRLRDFHDIAPLQTTIGALTVGPSLEKNG